MRRSDREVTEIDEILSIIDKCDSCNLGLSEGNMPYVVPLSFGYTFDSGSLSLYFHCAKDGKKSDIIAKNPKACFSMDCGRELGIRGNACSCTMYYESVMGAGTIESLSDPQEKRAGLLALMRHYIPEREFEFTDTEIAGVAVLRLRVSEFTAKRNKKSES